MRSVLIISQCLNAWMTKTWQSAKSLHLTSMRGKAHDIVHWYAYSQTCTILHNNCWCVKHYCLHNCTWYLLLMWTHKYGLVFGASQYAHYKAIHKRPRNTTFSYTAGQLHLISRGDGVVKAWELVRVSWQDHGQTSAVEAYCAVGVCLSAVKVLLLPPSAISKT